jgi:hypothetical protein
MSGTLEARLIRIEFQTGTTGSIYATSPDIRGLLVSRMTLDELAEALPQAITDMYAACGKDVVVSRAKGEAIVGEAWVALPACGLTQYVPKCMNSGAI